MTALDAATGSVIWQTPTGQTILSAPALRGNRIFFGNNSNKIYSLDAGTGQIVWEIGTDDFVVTAPAVGKDAIYVTGLDSVIRCIR